ncbi:MAG: PAS domain S-box protein, partial [Prolixibacteraceae bacterium]|nr:PAS domain S-box protein [Prolixibacteraceae bacterium]
EFRMKHKEGHWVWILDRGKVSEWTPDGKPLWMSGTHRDITNQKKTEETLKLEEARLEGLLRISQHPAETIQQLLDFALDEAINLTGSKIGYIYFYDDKTQKFILNSWSKEVMHQCTVTNPQTEYELEKTGIWGEAVRQGKPIMVNNFAAPNPFKKGTPEGHAPLHKFLTIPVFSDKKIVAVVGVANKDEDYNNSDIRQLQLMMDSVWNIAKRREDEVKFRNLVNQMQMGLAVHEIILDNNGNPVDYRFLDINPGFERVTGLKRKEILGKTIMEVLPETEKAWIERYGKVALSGEAVSFENYARELNRHYSVVAYRPQPNQFATIIEDISTRKQAEEAITKYTKKLENLSFSVTEMLKMEKIEDIYEYLAETLHQQYPGSVILFSILNKTQSSSSIRFIKGIPEQTIKRAIKLTGYNFLKKEFKIMPFHQGLFTSGKLHKFDKGLSEFSGPEFPGFAAKAIEKLLGIKQIYTIGINKDERLYATIHFFHRLREPITDNEYIELFVRQAGIIIDRKLIEGQLRESEERHRLMFETSQEAIVVIQDNKLVYFNQKLSDLIGYPPEELIDKEFMQFVYPDDLAEVKKNYEKRLKGEYVTKHYQFRVIRNDNSIRWVTLNGSLLNWKGKPSGFYFLNDITGLKEAEHQANERLKELGAFFRLSELTEQKDLPLHEICQRFVNDFPKSLQYPEISFVHLVINENEYKTSDYQNDIPWKISEPIKVFNNIAGLIEVGYLNEMPKREQGPFMKEEAMMLKGIAERLGHITERKQAEELLRQSEQKFRLLFENSPLGIYIGNADGSIEEGNRALLEILGSPSLEATKQINVLKFPPLVGNGYADSFIRCIEENRVIEIELPYITKWGKEVYLSSYLVPIAGPSGKTEKVFTLMQDITERKEFEHTLKKNAEELKQLNATKDKFFSIIAHDLRGPFSSLLNLVALLNDEDMIFSKEETKRILNSMQTTAETTYNLLENLLDWSRLQRGAMPFKPQQVNVVELFGQCDPGTIEMATEKGIRIETKAPEGIYIKADLNMIRSVLRNLVTNAIKFSNNGGRVIVKASTEQKGQILISVEDNGIGMNDEMVRNIFRIDAEVSRPGTNNEPSSGLGLILCKEFVEKHDGKIWAESAEGKGSKFCFTMPRKW